NALVATDYPTAEPRKAPMNSAQNPPTTSRRHESDVLHFVPKDWPTTELDSSRVPQHKRHEVDVLPFVPKDLPKAELPKAPANSSQSPLPKHQRPGGDVFHFVRKAWPTVEVRSGGPARCGRQTQCFRSGHRDDSGRIRLFCRLAVCGAVDPRGSSPLRLVDWRASTPRRGCLLRCGSDWYWRIIRLAVQR